MKMYKFKVKTKNSNYPIIIGNNILHKTEKFINSQVSNCQKVALIIDSNVPKKISTKVKRSIKKFDLYCIKLKTNEKIKNFKTASKLIDQLLKKNFHRNDCLIALGGGVLGDIAGLAASLTKRGIKFINIPTTLLSQVDSSIGGKTGVNSIYGKNLVGSFYQPEIVISDISTLNSLSKREIICGYAEILKHSLILDKSFFSWLMTNGNKILNLKEKKVLQEAIYRSCKIKAKVIQKHEKEKHLRMILNFGHTIGHAFEATKNFSKKINHGESVLLGMMCAIEFGYLKKILKKNDLNTIKKHYLKLSLPGEIKRYFKKKDVKKIITFMATDKKNIDENIKLILINRIGNTLKPKNYSKSVLKKFLSLKLT